MDRQQLGLFICSLALALLAACSGIEVRESQPESASLNTMTRYAWATEPVHSNELMALFDAAVKAEVNDQLQRRGYQLSDRAQAQFLVDYRFSEVTSDAATVSLAGNYDGWVRDQTGSQFVGWGDDPALSAHPKGVLSLAFVDAAGKGDLWEVFGAKILDERRDRSQVQANVKRVVAEIFSRFSAQAAN